MSTRRNLFTETLAGFVADPASMDHHGSGVIVNFAAFTDASYGTAGSRVIPAGTVGELDATSGEFVPHTTGRPLLLATDAVEGSRVAALSGYGAYTGGNVYVDLLPAATQAKAAALAPHFYLQTYADVRGAS